MTTTAGGATLLPGLTVQPENLHPAPPAVLIERYTNRDEWLAARRTGIGSSDAPAIFGRSSWATPLSIWADKLGLSEPSPETEQQRWGKALEPMIAAAFERETDAIIADPGDHTIYRHSRRPWQLATPDRFTGIERVSILELKSSRFADGWAEGAPEPYLIQGMHQLAVIPEAEGIVFAVLIGGSELKWCEYQREELQPAIDRLTEYEAEWWQQHIVEGVQPSPVAADIDLLGRLPRVEGKRIDLAEKAEAWHLEFQRAKAELKRWGERADWFKAQLLGAMGDAETGVIPGLGEYRAPIRQRAGYTVEPTEYRELRWKGLRK